MVAAALDTGRRCLGPFTRRTGSSAGEGSRWREFWCRNNSNQYFGGRRSGRAGEDQWTSQKLAVCRAHAAHPDGDRRASAGLFGLLAHLLAVALIDVLELTDRGKVGVAHRGDDLDVQLDARNRVVVGIVGGPADRLLLEFLL